MLIGLYIFLDEDSGNSKKAKNVVTTDSSSLIEKGEKQRLSYSGELDPDLKEKLEAYIHRGRREAREGNYIRALEEFTLARTLDPRNGSVAFYINRATQRLTESIKGIDEQAARFRSAKMYSSAHGKYCIILKMLEKYKDNRDLEVRYEQAEENAKEMSQKIGLDRDAINCK